MGNTCSNPTLSGRKWNRARKTDIGSNTHDATNDATNDAKPLIPSHDVASNPQHTNGNTSSNTITSTSADSRASNSSIATVTRSSLPPVPFSSGNDYTNGIQKETNLPGNYNWDANVFVVNNREELVKMVKWCITNGLSLRVKASGWSCNRFLDPSKSDNNNQENGVQVILAGEFDGVMKVDDPVGTVTAGAATQRQPIYSVLDESGRQLISSGECFTATASQEVGGLIANAVHDTMQKSFSPETVHSLEALVFDENKNPIIRSFSSADGDEYFAFFGGMGMTGIIVSATLVCVPKKYYNYRPYLPGSAYDDDDSFEVGSTAQDIHQLIRKYDIVDQGVNSTGNLLTFDTPENGGLTTYQSSFANALKDLCNKHKCDKDDVCAMFFLFPSPEEEEKASKSGQLADGSVPVDGLGRYWKRNLNENPLYTVQQDIYNDISPLMGKEYLQDPRTIDALMPSLVQVQSSVANMKWRYANLMNHTTKDSTPEEVSTALSDKCRHWAFCESGVAHTTGPNYIYLWAKATEFYIKEEDIDTFVEILQPAVVAMIKAAGSGSSIFADCRYALKSNDAFMSGWYRKDHLAIDIGCTKYHFTNEQYTEMTERVLIGCKEKNIDIRLHTGKFYVYDEEYTHHMYNEEIRGRFGAVVGKFDPFGIFAPQRWRNLFTENCTEILPPVDDISEGELN